MVSSSLAVITPVGPGHERIVDRCRASVVKAKPGGRSFKSVSHVIVVDHDGALGRSRARNQGMVDTDWYFFLDADDWMMPDALGQNDFSASATFGAVAPNGKVLRRNVFPCGRGQIFRYGARGTLSMGFFCRADVAKDLRFDEGMDKAEDFDFYMRLPDFRKIEAPLVGIGRDAPSATGPRAGADLGWIEACNAVIEGYR